MPGRRTAGEHRPEQHTCSGFCAFVFCGKLGTQRVHLAAVVSYQEGHQQDDREDQLRDQGLKPGIDAEDLNDVVLARKLTHITAIRMLVAVKKTLIGRRMESFVMAR